MTVKIKAPDSFAYVLCMFRVKGLCTDSDCRGCRDVECYHELLQEYFKAEKGRLRGNEY